MKSLKGRFVLAPDATALAIRDLPARFRKGLTSDPDSVVWSRVRGRTPSIIVSGDGNRLLERFRVPSSIPQAVVALSTDQGLDPEEVLTQGYALLREAVNRGLLLAQREWARAHIAPALQPGDRVGRWRVTRSIQVLEDSEVHQVADRDGRLGALKLARTSSAARLLAREAKVLSRLESSLAPRLLDRGRGGNRSFLVLEWREGQPPDVVAESLRAAGPSARSHLRRLVLGILDTYVRLHRQGVVHGDVHPRNLLIGSQGRVTVLDFGQAVLDGLAPPSGRAGVPSYIEPEAAAALLRRSRSLPASAGGEQYAVSALLFELVTGEQYLDFRHDAAAFLEQVIREPPRTFNSLGLPSWPDVEPALRRALAKAPSDRFPSLTAMARGVRSGSAPRDSAGFQRAVSGWLDQEVSRLSQPRRFPQTTGQGTGRQLSVYTGDAGQALALLRMARRRNDPELLSASDARCLWAESRALMPPGASTRLEPGALLQGTAGIALARAAIGHARSDDREAAGAVRYFAALARTRPASPELSAGTAGLLLGATRLLSLNGLGPGEQRLLREVQDRTARTLLEQGRRAGGPVQPLPWANLGMAHGWAGILFALLACEESRPGRRPPPELARWLDQLYGRGQAIGRGRRWPWLSHRNRRLVHGGSMTGWCNGSAGFAVLYAAAARVLGRPVDLARAEAAALDAWTHPPPGPDLCCGATGAAYAMLSLSRATGHRRWVARARGLAEHAFHLRATGTGRTRRPQSLFQGTAGLVSLLVDLSAPASATFPLIESLP